MGVQGHPYSKSSPVEDMWAKIEKGFEFSIRFFPFIGCSVFRTEFFLVGGRVSANPPVTKISGVNFVRSFFASRLVCRRQTRGPIGKGRELSRLVSWTETAAMVGEVETKYVEFLSPFSSSLSVDTYGFVVVALVA